MQTLRDVTNFVAAQPLLMALSRTIATFTIADCWIGGGVIRNTVWDYLHGYPVRVATASDVDVVYWDLRNANPESDLEIERRLTSLCRFLAQSRHLPQNFLSKRAFSSDVCQVLRYPAIDLAEPLPGGQLCLLLEESECLLNKGGMVLEDAAVPRVREDAQLRFRQPTCEFE
jgi:hypothetical protein